MNVRYLVQCELPGDDASVIAERGGRDGGQTAALGKAHHDVDEPVVCQNQTRSQRRSAKHGVDITYTKTITERR